MKWINHQYCDKTEREDFHVVQNRQGEFTGIIVPENSKKIQLVNGY